MKILITTFGTRGDIQPFVALAKGLRTAGHDAAIWRCGHNRRRTTRRQTNHH
jgi:sterol 3beta-glucosyltransferase